MLLMWLVILGVITTIGLGIFYESIRWLLTIVAPSLFALLVFCAGVRLQYRLLHAQFYLKIWDISYKRLTDIKEPFKGSTSFCLTISNQQNKARGISRFVLEIEFEDGRKKELKPVDIDDKTEIETTLYLQPNDPKTMRLNFVYDELPIQGSERLYVFDDMGAYQSVPINVSTMIEMAKKSESRSGEYKIE